jgi:hypothetical protein
MDLGLDDLVARSFAIRNISDGTLSRGPTTATRENDTRALDCENLAKTSAATTATPSKPTSASTVTRATLTNLMRLVEPPD